MSQPMTNPRSTLHALQPYGEGTPHVESLLSYFCRLAASHSVSTLTLSRTIAAHFQHDIAADFDWHERQISGIRESALTWAAGLSELTSIQGLDGLTFLPWRDVISQNGLSIAKRGQFCPSCFADDIENGHSPYFRLAWESEEVSVCTSHGRPLVQHCAHCGRDNIRHRAVYVVPGWCTHCGHSLASQHQDGTAIDPAALWRARQIGDLLASQSSLTASPSRDALIVAIEKLILEMDDGRYAAFARRIGVGKSTVHHWLRNAGTPTLEVSLNIAAQCGVSLQQLLIGDLSNWQKPVPERQLVLMLPKIEQKKRDAPRNLDWEDIEAQLQDFLKLPTPISVLEAARRLDVEARQLYLRANRTTRQLGVRWKDYLKRRQMAAVAAARPYLEQACLAILTERKAVTRREIVARVPAEILSPVAHLLDVIKDVQLHLKTTGKIA
jgi:transcriptional regulator with XRE-family HTH domain